MKLSRRLRMNASFVTPGNRLCDVGTDHGYIPIALVQEGVIPSALAMDVNEGPLERAKNHIREFHLESCIHTRLSDGVQALRPGEADSVLIAGMGGALTVKILREGQQVLETVQELILQPQSELDKVRGYLAEAGYRIVREDMVCEDGKYYPLMKAVAGEMRYDRDIFYHYGKLLLEGKHPVLREYLEQKKDNSERIVGRLIHQGSLEERTRMRIEELQNEISQIREALLYFEVSE